MSTNKLVTCPYDEAHKVKESRMQAHITKCKRNHVMEKEKYICPFNATHVLNKGEEAYHLQNCPDRAPIDRKMCQSLDKNNPYKGRTAVPSYNESAPVITEELWDVDIDTSGRGYVPPMEAPVGAIIEPPPHSKPAERRRLYQELHRLPNERDPKPPQSAAAAPVTPREPKQPTEASKVEMLRRQNVEQYQNLGLGRGRSAPPPPTSRIAANFFAPSPVSNHQPPTARSYSSAMSTGISQLGLGRGNVSRPADNFPSFLDNSEDFPALGLGRGVSSAPRNGVNGAGPRW